MQKNTRDSQGYHSRSGFGGQSSEHRSEGHGFSGNRRRGFGRGRGGSSRAGFIDETKFINRAPKNIEAEQYVSENKFSDFNLDARLHANVEGRGYNSPTAIQDRAIPAMLDGRDIIGLADTGTGKTAAFLLPFINKILKDDNEKLLIVAPTRELALQINAEFMEFSKGLSIYSAVIIGGANIRKQVSDLKRGVNVVIGTPGRLKDLVDRRILGLSKCKNVVLDEADRMLDMGFIDDIRFLLDKLPEERHTAFFSATFSGEIERLSGDFLNNPIKMETKKRDTSANVDQDVVRFDRFEDRIEVLHELLVKEDFKKVLIFGKTKISVEDLSESLIDRGFKAASIHGDKSQGERQRALRAFKEDRIKVLVATDVAARGLDIPEVSHVINYDLPSTYEDYIHRIGRTGRANRKGVALTFVKGHLPNRENSFSSKSNKGFSKKPSSFSRSRSY